MPKFDQSAFTNALTRRALMLGAATVGVALPFSASAGLDPSDETWDAIKTDYFDDTQFKDGSHMMSLDAPKRAHDAAIVPLDIRVSNKYDIEKLTLVIDENPVPLAAIISFGSASANASLQTRVRINAYSYIRVIAHDRDGSLYMVKRFVKASGGCAAPSGKDPIAAKANMGKMRLRRFSAPAPKAGTREAQVMIRHPNHSGFQMDQVTLLFVPPDFVETIVINQGDDMILKVEGGISLSEDPNLRFFYNEDTATPITVTAYDTENRVFTQDWSSSDA